AGRPVRGRRTGLRRLPAGVAGVRPVVAVAISPAGGPPPSGSGGRRRGGGGRGTRGRSAGVGSGVGERVAGHGHEAPVVAVGVEGQLEDAEGVLLADLAVGGDGALE